VTKVNCNSENADFVNYYDDQVYQNIFKPDGKHSECLKIYFNGEVYWGESLCNTFQIKKVEIDLGNGQVENMLELTDGLKDWKIRSLSTKNVCDQDVLTVGDLLAPTRMPTAPTRMPTKMPTKMATKMPTRMPTTSANNNGKRCDNEVIDDGCDCEGGEVRFGDEKNKIWTAWIKVPEDTPVIKCSARSGGFFQFDPAKDVVKYCFCRTGPTPAEEALDASKVRAAEEGQTFTCPGGLVSYGTDLPDHRTSWRSDLGDGLIHCSNGAFGSDPHKQQKKWCYCAPKPDGWSD
jgi:hypothetical protein